MDNRKFWNERYESLPELGSGPGSRAYAAWFKQRLTEEAIANCGVRSVLDIGCGDLYWFPAAQNAGVAYMGVDISDVIVARNRARFPQLQFLLHDVANTPLNRTADLVVCFDVLIHQIEPEQFRATLRNVLACISNVGLVSYLTPDASSERALPDTPADVLQDEAELLDFLGRASFPRAQTAFHGELSGEINRLVPGANARIVGAYPAQTIYEITLPKRVP
jgi:SAM-dependent methyltransferase